MTPQAEKLREQMRVRLESIFCLDDVCDEEAEAVVLFIATELGITPEMVEAAQPGTSLSRSGQELQATLRVKAASALSTLLEVAGVQQEVNDG